ncbi:GNAT family N-acetyltransferase [Psychrobacillus sp. NPDC058041]|uniref:GNAT family N-acetyltransferase n=1 Tax=Psychrobacillus sp. NPDC058041 TaxID=3346310 RepID=UPI0036DC2F2E
MMKRITTFPVHPEIRELLSFATSKDRIDLEYEKYIRSPERGLYGLELKGEIVGCIGIEFMSSHCCEIKHIAVSPIVRGNNIGSEMIKFVCNKHSLSSIKAETDNEAVKFYEKNGFNITSLGEKYPGIERFFCEYTIQNPLGTRGG